MTIKMSYTNKHLPSDPRHMRCLVPFGVVFYLACGLGVAVVSLFYFVILETTDKSSPAWRSRELNSGCRLDDFWDAHDLWHFFASHALMMVVLVVMQIQKPCRDCYLKYKLYQHPELVELETEEGEKKMKGKNGERQRFLQEPEVLKIIPLTNGESDQPEQA